MEREFKTFQTSETKVLDEEEGIVECLVAITDIRDNVRDKILPGSFGRTLRERTPKGVWSHDWNTPISRTLAAEEIRPGDPRLPTDVLALKGGALKLTTKFLTKTDAGRNAFEVVKEFGPEQEWSIGYKVPPGGANYIKAADGRSSGGRDIHDIDVYEYSPVLFGAHPLTGTLSMKSLSLKSNGDVAMGMTGTASSEIVPGLSTTSPGGPSAAPKFGETEGLQERSGHSHAHPDGDGGSHTHMHTHANGNYGHGAGDSVTHAHDHYDAENVPITAPNAMKELAVAELEDKAWFDLGMEYKKDYSDEKRQELADKGWAMKDGSWPIEDGGDLEDAIQSFGRGNKSNSAVKSHIVKQAKRLDMTDKLPDDWSTKDEETTGVETKASQDQLSSGATGGRLVGWDVTPANPDRGAGDGASHPTGAVQSGTPPKAASGLATPPEPEVDIRQGRSGPQSEFNAAQAATVAAGAVARIRAAKGPVTDEIEWGDNRQSSSGGVFGKDDRPAGLAVKIVGGLAGSYEERQDSLRDAIRVLGKTNDPDGDGDGMAYLEATFDDHCIVSVQDGDAMDSVGIFGYGAPPPDGDDDDDDDGPNTPDIVFFEVPYTWSDGAAQIGTPTQVEFTTQAVKTVFQEMMNRLESKDGRVLSGANAKKLQEAMSSMVDVMKAAGLDWTPEVAKRNMAGVEAGESDDTSADNPQVSKVPNTTDKASVGEGKVLLSQAELDDFAAARPV